LEASIDRRAIQIFGAESVAMLAFVGLDDHGRGGTKKGEGYQLDNVQASNHLFLKGMLYYLVEFSPYEGSLT